MYLVDEDRCTGCGICLDYCDAGAMTIAGEVARIEQAKCTYCGECCEACPLDAIYEVVGAPVPYSPPLAPRTSIARRTPAVVVRGSSRLSREDKAAAIAAVLPAVSRILVRLVDRFLLRENRGFHTSGIAKRDYAGPDSRAGRGRHRWRGGS